MLQSTDELIFKNKGPLADLQPLPVCCVFSQCCNWIRMDVGY